MLRQWIRRRLATYAAITAAAIALAVIGLPGIASASTTAPARTSGVEVLYGQTHSTANNPAIPLRAEGVVSSRGYIVLGNGPPTGKGDLEFGVGKLDVLHVQSGMSQSGPTSACKVSYSVWGTFKVLGGTGVFYLATGHGNFAVYGWAILPKKNGKCDMNAEPTMAFTVFAAIGVMSVRV